MAARKDKQNISSTKKYCFFTLLRLPNFWDYKIMHMQPSEAVTFSLFAGQSSGQMPVFL